MKKIFQVIIIALSLVLLCGAAVCAQSNFSLGQSEITLAAGDTYVFMPQFETSEPAIPVLSWILSDPNVAKIDADTNTLHALKAGKVLVMAQTFDRSLSAYCTVTVSGETEPTEQTESKSLSVFTNLSDSDLAKIEAGGFLDYINFIKMVRSSGLSISLNSDQIPSYHVIIQSDRANQAALLDQAAALGITDIKTYQNFDSISMKARADMLAELLAGNNAIQLISIDRIQILPPDSDQSLNNAKDITLGSNVENITTVSAIHNANVNGEGTIIAILDTGLDANHPEYQTNGQSRVVFQSCHSTTDTTENTLAACKSPNSALPNPPDKQAIESFLHGSHVAGIAAGKGGIAPLAQIAAVQVFSELIYTENNQTVYSSGSFDSDQLAGIDDVLTWVKNGANIVAVNLSLGYYKSPDYAYSTNCDSKNEELKAAFDKLLAYNILVPVAAGNEGEDKNYLKGTVGVPACLSNAFTVSALDDSNTAALASYSDFGSLVSIVAPGTEIYSSILPDVGYGSYGYMSGTSMATPVISGAVALLRSAIKDQTASDTKAMLTGLTSLSVTGSDANSASLTKPVLNFTMIARLTAAPADLSASTNGTAATFSFTDDPNVTGTQIQVSASRDGTYSSGCTSEDTACTVTGQTAGQDLYYKARKYFIYNGVTYYGASTAPAYITIGQDTPNTVTPTPTQNATQTLAAIQTATQVAIPTQTQAAVLTQTKAVVQTSTQAVVQTVTQAAIPTQTQAAVLTQTQAVVQTATQAAIQTATQEESPYQTIAAVLTQTEAVVQTATQAMALTQTQNALYALGMTQTMAAAQTQTQAANATQTAIAIQTQQAATPTPQSQFFYGPGWPIDDILMRNGKSMLPGTGFSSRHFTDLSLKPGNLVYQPTGYTLEIPSIDSKANLVGVPADINGYPVSWLGNEAGLLSGSALPGKGVSIIAAHNHLNTMATGPFLFLLNLKENDRIFVHTPQNELLSFRVYANESINPDDVKTIKSLVKKNSMILITCEDETDQGSYLHRRVVFAEPLK